MLTLQILVVALAAGLIVSSWFLFRYRLAYQRCQLRLDKRVERRTENLSRSNLELTVQIARHQEAELLLASTQNYYHSILNSLPSMIIGLNSKGKVSLWNTAASTITGVDTDAAVNRDVYDLVPGLKVYKTEIKHALAEEMPTLAEEIEFFLGTNKRFVDLSIYPLPKPQAGAVILIDDVTQRIDVENLMVQNEKLLSLGEMAAGLAHEINNPLSAVLSNLQNLQRRTSVGLAQNQTAASITGIDLQNLQDYFKERGIDHFIVSAKEAAERAVSIVNNILNFAHSGQSAQGPERINDLITDVVELEKKARSSSKSHFNFQHKISTSLQAQPDICECSPPEIQQVMLNLIRNAIQACESQQRAADIQISTSVHKSFLVIEVKDNGPGISKQNLPHIFDPFFTTKGVGEGTGLGLSVSYLIVTEHHNGTIEVESNTGGGTRFVIKLPLLVHDC